MLKVTVFTKPNCPGCKATVKKLAQLNIEHASMALDDESIERFRSEGLASAPVVEVDLGEGAQWRWAGYSPTQIDRLVEILAA